MSLQHLSLLLLKKDDNPVFQDVNLNKISNLIKYEKRKQTNISRSITFDDISEIPYSFSIIHTQ